MTRPTTEHRVWIYVPDLLDRSRVLAATPDAVVVASPAALLEAQAGDVVLLDLSRPGVVEMLPQLGHVRSVGFASHVDEAVLASARAAGCSDVLPRSAFFRRWARPSS